MTDTERSVRFNRSRWAAVLGLTLCLPFLFSCFTAVLDLQPLPPFLHRLYGDGFQPTVLGRIVMLGMLGGLPLAFVVNYLPMVTSADPRRSPPFRVTPTHTVIGMTVLFGVLISLSQTVVYELRPFVAPLGPGSTMGRILFLLGLLVLPVAFLLNLLPRLGRARSGGDLTFQPTSINLILGAATLLVILMIASGFLLEEIACSIGIPNCD